MEKILSTKINSKWIIITGMLLIILLISFSIWLAHNISSEYKSIYTNEATEVIRSEYEQVTQVINEFENQALSVAISVSNMDLVRGAYSEEDSLKAIEILNTEVQPLINELKSQLGYKKYKIHFHKAPAQSFLRLWNQTGGDDLSSFRKTILHVSQTQKALKSIEIGKGGFALRGIAPIYSLDNKFVGSVEVFFELHDIFPYLSGKHDNYYFIALANKKDITHLFFQNEIEKYYLEEINDYIVFQSTLNKKYNLNDILNKIDLKPNNENDEINFLEYKNLILSSLPIFDFSDKDVGKLIIGVDISPYILSASKRIEITLFAQFIFTVTMIALMIIFIRLSIKQANQDKELILAALKETNIAKNELMESIAIKNRFFRIIAHDLRSPFNTLIGYSNLLIQNSNLSQDKKNEYIDIISDTSEKTLGLLENLLMWADTQTNRIVFEHKQLNLKEISVNVVNLMIHSAHQKNIEIINTISNDIHVLADQQSLETIFRNLISNAIKFTPQKGEIKLIATPEDKTVKISVTDNGIGIKDINLTKLFNLETKTTTRGTENEKGSGLGLLLVKDFVEKNNGNISIKSNFGSGTSITFTLPLA